MAPVEVVRTYLEMESPVMQSGRAPIPPGYTLAREPGTPGLYRALYEGVGRDYHWRDRLAWSDARLASHLADPRVDLWVLRESGAIRGFFELQRHDDGSVELAYFGLMPAAIGRGLGRAMLTAAIDAAWSASPAPRRVWVHTCTLDHPSALANYLARGFRVTRTERYTADTTA